MPSQPPSQRLIRLLCPRCSQGHRTQCAPGSLGHQQSPFLGTKALLARSLAYAWPNGSGLAVRWRICVARASRDSAPTERCTSAPQLPFHAGMLYCRTKASGSDLHNLRGPEQTSLVPSLQLSLPGTVGACQLGAAVFKAPTFHDLWHPSLRDRKTISSPGTPGHFWF